MNEQQPSVPKPGGVIIARRSTAVLFYLLLLLGHVAHVFEEIWARFWIMDRIYGEFWFIVINWILLGIPVFFFFHWLRGKKWARTLSLLYAGVMILNGLGHNAATIVTGRYKGGFAGGFSGILLIIFGYFLIDALRWDKTTD